MTCDYDCSNSDPLLQLTGRFLGIAKRRTRVRPSLHLCSDIGQGPSSNSVQITESRERISEDSKQRVEVTGS